MKEKKDFSLVSYTFGILSIVFAFFNSSAGLALGIIGFFQSKNSKDQISKKAKKLSLIGIILSIILLIIQIIVTYYFTMNALETNFPLV